MTVRPKGEPSASAGSAHTGAPRCCVPARVTPAGYRGGMASTVLAPGDKAPSFSLVDQHGASRSLAEFSGRRVLVFFYPKASTPGCTTQACGLRDVAHDIGDTQILGISPDTPKRQATFDEKFGLGFPLLADEDHAVAEAFGVWGEKKLYGRAYMGIIRSAFLLSADGTVEQAWYKISPKDTPVKLMKSLAGG
jgi:thioredoxin-dependent peroxiredoxin